MANTQTTARPGVMQAVRAHIGGLTAATFAAKYGPAVTMAQLAAGLGYPGKQASALRAAFARNLGNSTAQQGVTRYPPLTYPQWCKLAGVSERAAHNGTTTAQQGQLAKQATAVWRAARGGGKQAKQQARKRKAQQAPTPQPTPTQQAE